MTDGARKGGWTRRVAMFGGGAAMLGGIGIMAARKGDNGGAHDRYFLGLSDALKRAGIARPVLIIDRARLDRNIAAARATLAPKKVPLRVVVKSLPSPGLIDHVMKGMETDRLMVFNGAMLGEMSRLHPAADLLLGKPLPPTQFAQFLDTAGPGAASHVQWLVDTRARVAQYAEIARTQGIVARINFEIDVGLHRGGFADAPALAAALAIAKANPHLIVSGLMGYDPHVPKMSDPDEAFAKAQNAYRAANRAVRETLSVDPATLTLNTAGSPTYAMHAKGTVGNEVSVGSAFVKPVDFDLETLERHVPAAFIATPVIKALDRMRLPGNEWLSGPLNFMDPNSKRAFFIYGGHWLATPVSPPGLENSSLFGRSSNQELLTGSDHVNLQPGDQVFLRPTQSEAVFFQFGDIAIYDGNTIADYWPTLPVSA